MAIRRTRSLKSLLPNSNAPDRQPKPHRASVNDRSRSRNKLRKQLLETLEERQLLAVGPQLIGIQPNNSDLLNNGDVRTISPRELTFRFDDSQVIDPSTLSGIQISSSGRDGTFGLNSTSSDLGSNGQVDLQLTSLIPGQSLTVNVSRADLGAGAAPVFSTTGSAVNVVLNSNPTGSTTAAALITAVQDSPLVGNLLQVRINGGDADTDLGQVAGPVSSVAVNQTNDRLVQPGSLEVGDAPNQNEVTFKFASELPDDVYKVDIFGFDDPSQNVVGLRATNTRSGESNLFQPTQDGTRQDTLQFRLDLGSKVTGVVPQPVTRVNGELQQARDTIIVYFDADKLIVENDAAGEPTARSVENPDFYQLILTNDTVRNTDDQYYAPSVVTYNASANTATLQFASDIHLLPGSAAPASSFRLRIGNKETQPITPTVSEATATAFTDFGTDGAARVRLSSLQVGEVTTPISLRIINSNSGVGPVVNSTTPDNVITLDLGRSDATIADAVQALQTSSASASLIDVMVEPGSDLTAVIGNVSLAYSPVRLLGLGSSYDTATDLGIIGSDTRDLTSIILTSSIDAQAFELDLPGSNLDPGQRILPQNIQGSFEDHISEAFGPDATAGITTIYYNFRSDFSQDNAGNTLVNAISESQKTLVRQSLGLWANYIGVQFVETSDLGVTFATGSLTGLIPSPGTLLQAPPGNFDFGTRIDPAFEESLIVLSAQRSWDNNYGEDYFRTVSAAVGMILGLEFAGDTQASNLLRFDPEFLAGSGTLIDLNDAQLNASDEKYEPIFPGNQDITHGQYLYRPDGRDIDLYRFEVDFGDSKVGLLTAETFSQRLINSSALNTNLELYRETLATAQTNFGVGDQLQVGFTAVRPGTQGNKLQIFFTQSDRGTRTPLINVFPNAISIDLNNTIGSETRVSDLLDALANDPAALQLVNAELLVGDASTDIGNNQLTQNPVVMSGGKIELVSQNDDYFSKDSFLRQSLSSGVYFLGVSASGNDDYNAAVAGTGFGGQSQGDYELRITYRAAVDTSDALQDVAGSFLNDPSVGFDGDGNGVPGGTHDFWFETRALNRVLTLNAGGNAAIEGKVIVVTGSNGAIRRFEFSSDAIVTPGNIRIANVAGSSQSAMASAIASAINSQSALGVSAVATGASISLNGERLINIDTAITIIDIVGKTIFVDKSAGPNASGTLANPFNNISGQGVPNAFAAALPGDIVRIIGNGGGDGLLQTIGDNFAYEIGFGLLPGSVLSDGSTMDVPRGVTTMIDAGAIFKLQRARIGVGSSNLGIDRSGANLQVLGAPSLLDQNGNALRNADGTVAAGSVYFTSWLDEATGRDNYNPTTTPAPGDWGGISFRRDVDASAGRKDLEDEGVFLQYVNHADIRFGGGTLTLDSIQQTVNPIQMLDTRPTITYTQISNAANAALSAVPNSFEETNFHEPRFQLNGLFTSDYDRVGPNIHHNTLVNNSVNGLFIRVESGQTLTVPGRFDDIDVVHVITENLIVSGDPGSALLDGTSASAELVSLAPAVGGELSPGTFNYKITLVDRYGYESIASDATSSVTLSSGETAIQLAGLPSVTGDFVSRRLYRSGSDGSAPFMLVANLDGSTSRYLDIGNELGGILERDRSDVSNVVLTDLASGTLAAGTYNYRVVSYDSAGREGLASNPTNAIILGVQGSVELNGLPQTIPGNIGRRIYRSNANGTGPYSLITELPDSTSSAQTTFIDNGIPDGPALSAESQGIRRPNLAASLVVDPGAVIKLESARIEATFGSNLIIEGTDDLPIVFTSRLDDRFGAGSTFDTNNNGGATTATPRDWGGIYVAPTSNLSVDYTRFAFGGGVTNLDSTFRAFNTIELHQATGRIANSIFENNADGFGGQGPGARFGRLSNAPATIFVRGAQPIIIDNVFLGNTGSVIDIDANSMIEDVQGDRGRQSGDADLNPNYEANRGPLIRNNRLDNNGLNGLEIRGDFLTTESVWDDTDIVHVVFDEIFVSNLQHDGGLRLQSSPRESLVVKFEGYGSNFNDNLGAGLTARGEQAAIGNNERVGGTIHVLGQPGFPVILTSFKDDTVGAGLLPDGRPQTDTNNDGFGSRPDAGDWRGLFLDQFSNDRNVAKILETEDFTASAPGPNGTTFSAQVLGDLAGNFSNSNENLRIGFSVEGVLSQNEDVDVYSFSGAAGSEVWLDVDHTTNNLDLVLEVLDANGVLLARSDNSTEETIDPSLIFTSGSLNAENVNPLPSRTEGVRRNASGLIHEDGTTNPLDPGLRVVLPGSPGTRSTFYFRLRSASIDPNASAAGLTSGSYEVQVRLQELQEFAGSTVNFADIRYATNGIHLRGLPGESPLLGEVAEDESVVTVDDQGRPLVNGQVTANNGTAVGQRQIGSRPQFIGNILDTSKGAISVAGEISSPTDVDFYYITIDQEDTLGFANGLVPLTIDVDYADGLNRPDTQLYIFEEEGSLFFENQYRLIATGDDSNIADDQRKPLTLTDFSDLSRGSVGPRDAYIGPISLPAGNYLIGVSSVAARPRALITSPSSLRPLNSIRRIVDEDFVAGQTTAEPPVVENFLPSETIGATGELVSAEFDLGAYSAADLPRFYLDYTLPNGTFEVFVRQSNGTETSIASSAAGPNQLDLGRNSVAVSLEDFAGQDDLQIVFRASNGNTEIRNVIIGFAERGESVDASDEAILLDGAALIIRDESPPQTAPTRVFSLETYEANEEPTLVFNYEIIDGFLDVFVATDFGTFLVASSDPAVNPATLLVEDVPAQAFVDMSPFAGLENIQVIFSSRVDNPTTIFIDTVYMELGDGSRFFSDEPNATFARQNVPSSAITTGKYQFEVRLAETFSTSNAFGGQTLTTSYDTNDRLSESTTITLPAGDVLTDGDTFQLSDGGVRVVFEYTVDGTVGTGNIPIRFVATDPAHVIARKTRDAINNPNIQSRLKISAATTSGIESGSAGRDTRLNLFGNATLTTLSLTNPAGEILVAFNEGSSDRNIRRHQGQILIQNSFVRQSRDYGIWSEAAGRLTDPRDVLANQGFIGLFLRQIHQDRPDLGPSAAGHVRNLPSLNDNVDGGLLPGVVIQNNILEEGGLGGISIVGETPIWMVTPSFLPATDNSPLTNDIGTHFGSAIDDGDQLVIDSDRSRLTFEFDDLSGAAAGGPAFGSGTVEGNGVSQDAVPVWYRDDTGSLYLRQPPAPLTPFGSTGLEAMMALRDAVNGSIFVTNGTTQMVRATAAESLSGAFDGAPLQPSLGYPNYINRPALYLEGVTNIQFVNGAGGGNPFDIEALALGHTPQPHARLVNNTIIGSDGRASFNGEQPGSDNNDTLADAIQTWQGTSHNPISYTATGAIGDNAALVGGVGTDVDIYQFKLDVGERVRLDVDTPNSNLDSILQIFDSNGVAQFFTNGAGQLVSISQQDNDPRDPLEDGNVSDPFIDFTATVPGVYYAAISSQQNDSFDPLSFASRVDASSLGSYTLSVEVLHPQQFTIVAENATEYAQGDTFTIFQVADFANSNRPEAPNGRTFEFTFTGAVSDPQNIAIPLNANYLVADVARAIAAAINQGDGGQPALPNAQQLDNGRFGVASPLEPVRAIALGGVSGIIDANLNGLTSDIANVLEFLEDPGELGEDALSYREVRRRIGGDFREINPGLEIFPRRNDGVLPTHSSFGIGHDRGSTVPFSPTSTSRGDGTSEKFVVIHNAAFIQGNNSVIVDPDVTDNNNLDQLIPETGILATRGASPTILNNVFFNLQTPIINEESRRFPISGGVAPYGTNNPNQVFKPGEVIIGGSVFQYTESATTSSRFGTGIESSPTNVPNTSLDLNFNVPNGTRLFVNAQGSEYLPAEGSLLIDSSIDSLPERPSLTSVKNSIGVSVSPLLAPTRDAAGQLRIDDPDVAPPSGQGQNIFKDRGAFDRADFVGPAAILLDPTDNDSLGVDSDSAVSFVELTSGVYPEFRIQLADGNEPANPFKGIGIDDNSVVNGEIDEKRLSGASVVVFEDGRLLVEGIDYRFAYNSTRDEIVLTPLAGVWKNDRVYEISLNNKDRFVLAAPSGDLLSDGEIVEITDASGNQTFFEFDSGFRLQLPQGLEMIVPLAGGSAGGVNDGDRVTIDDGTTEITFELDRNANFLAGNTPVTIRLTDSQDVIAQSLIDAINASPLSVTPILLGNGRVFIGTNTGTTLDTSLSSLTQPVSTTGLEVPEVGARPGGITDGQTFTVNDGLRSRTFEFDSDNVTAFGNAPIDISTANTAADVVVALNQALSTSNLNLAPSVVSDRTVRLGLSATGSVALGTSNLSLVGAALAIQDGESVAISINGNTTVFEFDSDGQISGDVAVPFSLTQTQEAIGETLAQAIRSVTSLELNALHFSDGNVSLGGDERHSVSAANANSVLLTGLPGVQPSTTLEIIGTKVLQIPGLGGSAVNDNTTFQVTGPGGTQTFEFDGNFSGPSTAGNVVVRYTASSSANDLALNVAGAISTSGIGVTARNIGDGRVDLGLLPDNAIDVRNSGLTLVPGSIVDGDNFSISNGANTVVFEFENVSLNSGTTNGRTIILYDNDSSIADILSSMKAAIEDAGLNLSVVVGDTSVRLLDSPGFVTDASNAPSLRQTGLPGGANAVRFVKDALFDGSQVAESLVAAINASGTVLQASVRGGNTLFVENALTVTSSLDSYSIRAIQDLAGNDLKPNRVNNDTRFTILMPGSELDYGDAPDPFTTTAGRYATQRANDGARHVITQNGPQLRASDIVVTSITAEGDGLPTPNADGDSGDDGVSFVSLANPSGIFNKNITTEISVSVTSRARVDAWIDFNADGDWDDPGEQILTSQAFDIGTLSQSFNVTVPASTPNVQSATKTFARFRVSSAGGLLPDGLAVDGEVEDYAVTIVPGTPPTAVDDVYEINEDSIPGLITSDATGQLTPGFSGDDGLGANDQDPEGGPFSVIIVDGPQNGTLNLNEADGTFTYTPDPDFFGAETFTYKAVDGVLTSNNIATVTINVRPVNDAPIAGIHEVDLAEDELYVIDITALTAIDRPGPANESAQQLTITAFDSTSENGASISIVDGVLTYTPILDAIGIDTFTYTVTDDGQTNGVPDPLSTRVTVTLTVRDENDAPIAGDDSLTTLEETPVSQTEAILLSNDSPGPANEASQELTLTGVESTSENGGTVVFANGVVTYTPAVNFAGTDRFVYFVTDNGTSEGIADPKTSRGTVTVEVTNVNDSPTLTNSIGTISVAEDATIDAIDLNTVFFDPDVATSGDILSFAVVSNSNPGLVTPSIVNGGGLDLSLLADQNGQSTIVIEARDSSGATVTDTITLLVSPVEDAPRLLNPIPDQTFAEDATSASVNVSPTYIFDPDVLTDGDVLTLDITANSNPSLVTAVVDGGDIRFSFAPESDGTATITVRGTDTAGNQISDTFVVTVEAVNDGPIARSDTYSVPEGATLVANDALGTATPSANDNGVLVNDSDIENDPFTAQLVSDVQNGTLELNSNGTFTYTPNGTAGSSDLFTYRAVDSRGAAGNIIEVILNVTTPLPPKHQNPINRLDVDANSVISPRDALIVINYINKNGSNTSVENLPDPPPYRDVNGNGRIDAQDALLVIFHLNKRVGSNGEGESAADFDDSQIIIGGSSESLSGYDLYSSSDASASNGINPRYRLDSSAGIYGPQRSEASSRTVLDQSLADYLGDSSSEIGDFDYLGDSAASTKDSFSKDTLRESIDLALAGLLGDDES
jgi:hypothetical protein